MRFVDKGWVEKKMRKGEYKKHVIWMDGLIDDRWM